MSPLDATTPAELFGAEVLRDRRSLKRAYATLVRSHPPEVDPKAFAHIRRLYEQAEAQRVAAVDEGPIVGPASVRAGVRSVDEVVGDFQPDAWRQTVESLRELAGDGDRGAAVAGYGILVAVAPEEAVAWLVELVDVPGVQRVIAQAVLDTFAATPGRARDPALDGLFARLEPDIAGHLRSARLRTVASYHPARAAKIWRRDWPLFAGDAQARVQLLTGPLDRVRWHLSPEDLTHLLHVIDDINLPLDDDQHQELNSKLHAALAVARLRVPELRRVADAVVAGHREALVTKTVVLLDMMRCVPEPRVTFNRLELVAPGVAAAVYEMLEQITVTTAYLEQWSTGQVAPTPWGVSEERWLADIERLEAEAIVEAGPGKMARMLGGAKRMRAWESSDKHRHRIAVRLVQQAATLGYWPHEVAGALERLHGPKRALALDMLVGEPVRTLSLVHDAHVRRAMRQTTVTKEKE